MHESYEKHVEKYGEKDTQIERINVNGNYCNENCRWATKKEQGQNRRTNRIFIYDGKKMCLSELAKKVGIDRKTITSRIDKYGWSFERAII